MHTKAGIQVFEIVIVSNNLDARLGGHDELQHSIFEVESHGGGTKGTAGKVLWLPENSYGSLNARVKTIYRRNVTICSFEKQPNLPSSPFSQGEKPERIFHRIPQKLSSLWKREDGRDFWQGPFKHSSVTEKPFSPIE
jgi:hypothetical protein